MLAGMVVLLAACGGTATSNTLPGQGKPTIVLGETTSDEELLLGELYSQAFRAMGYIVDLRPNIGASQETAAALQSGQINAYPEYLGVIAAADAGHTARLTSEAQAEQIAQLYEQSHGATVMMPVTPFSETGTLIALVSFAQQRNLTTIPQLKFVPFRVKFGDDAAGQTRYDGYAGLQQAYGLTNLQFVPLPTGKSIYDALDSHLVQVGDAISTDPQLAGVTYAVLSDPKNIFGFQHVALVIETSLLNQLGPAFQEAYRSLTGLLTTTVMRALNRAVTIDGEIPASVAHSFLLANRLLSS